MGKRKKQIHLPFGNKTKSQIIELLAGGKSRLADLHAQLQAKSRSISEHAVYSQLLQLEKLGFVERENQAFKLNAFWLQNVLGFFQDAYHNLNNNAPPESKRIPVDLITFPTLKSFDDFLVKFETKMVAELNNSKNRCIIWSAQHFWWNLLYIARQHEMLKLYKNNDIHLYSLYEGDTALDRYGAQVYASLGMSAKTGIKLFPSDVGIYNHHVIFLSLPLELKNEMDKVFNSASAIEDIDVNYFLNELCEQKHNPPIQAFICQNSTLAEQLRKKVLAVFGNK